MICFASLDFLEENSESPRHIFKITEVPWSVMYGLINFSQPPPEWL